ncbi:hypothetical protein CC86DRAFT_402660 [Ophiobolus disseminans]|uniref:Uncharacterized protein n=1 Tax=Ophiobolus disseminans TaxID=1469910 RepID=A0A6A7ABW9_9PLEO|nr:hypothetical protein CC86DRAFT_402660 [Ophiobolus disseminans]
MRTSAFLLFLTGFAFAAPADKKDLFPKCKATKDLVYNAAQLLRGNSNNLKFCLEKIFKIKPVIRTIMVDAKKTVQVVNTVRNVVTTVTIFVPCANGTPIPQKRGLDERADNCPEVPLLGFACGVLSYACDCLVIPTPTITKASVRQVTAVITQRVDVTTTVQATTTETPAAQTETAAGVATLSRCKAEAVR